MNDKKKYLSPLIAMTYFSAYQDVIMASKEGWLNDKDNILDLGGGS